MKANLKRVATVLVDELLKSDNMMTEAVEFYGYVMCLFAAKRREKDRIDAKNMRKMFDRRPLAMIPKVRSKVRK